MILLQAAIPFQSRSPSKTKRYELAISTSFAGDF